MDTTKTITHVSLCAGYGGIDLGLSRAIPNLRTIAFSEIEAFACANLVSKMEAGQLEPAPIWTNLKTFPWSEFRDRVDILSGGYPCQPFSAAGKRLGKDDPRHLWPWIADGIVSMRPRVCFFENVEGHISLGLREVISELEGLGYKTAWGIFSAREVGAPHQRKRVFIMAYDQRQRIEELGGQVAVESKQYSAWNDSANTWPSRPGQPQHGWEPPRVVGDSNHGRLASSVNAGRGTEADRGGQSDFEQADSGTMVNTSGWSNGQQQTKQQRRNTFGGSSEERGAMGDSADERSSERRSREVPESRSKQEPKRSDASPECQAQPSLGGDSNGSTNRMDDAELFVTSDNRTDELRLLGNGVVPATATRAFLTLMDQLLNQ